MTSRIPVTWPALVMRRNPWLRAQPIQMLSSFLRRTVRWKLIPHLSLFGSKFSVRNGISISIVQPSSLCRTRAFQMPSHARLSPFVLKTESAISPDGFISKK